jgi:glycosyltransferase involved in cell wall biosynthesis
MVEAMACGTPVVALRAGSVPEMVVDGLTGYICERPEELPAALRRVDALDPEACRAHMYDRFDVPDMVEGYEAVYRRAITQAG